MITLFMFSFFLYHFQRPPFITYTHNLFIIPKNWGTYVLASSTFLCRPSRYSEYLLVTDGENDLTRLV